MRQRSARRNAGRFRLLTKCGVQGDHPPAGVWGRLPVAQSSRWALAAPAARFAPRLQVALAPSGPVPTGPTFPSAPLARLGNAQDRTRGACRRRPQEAGSLSRAGAGCLRPIENPEKAPEIRISFAALRTSQMGFWTSGGRDAHDANSAPFIFRLAFADYRPSAAVSAEKRPLLAAKDTPMPTPGYWRVKALPAISSPEAYRPSTA